MTAEFKLTRRLRDEVLREGRTYIRRHGGAYNDEVADHMVGVMLTDEEKFGTANFPAIAVSDYAYGMASFIMGGREYVESSR